MNFKNRPGILSIGDEAQTHFGGIAAAILGIGGLICDRHKLLAMITTVIAGALMLFYLRAYIRFFF